MKPIIPTVLPTGYSRLSEVAQQIDEASRLLTPEIRPLTGDPAESKCWQRRATSPASLGRSLPC
jgi:hypothetical protein